MLDFAQLPAEVNSALMYSGAGSGPLLAAAAAWHGLATELQATASSYAAVIAGLTNDAWRGPAAASMAATAAPQAAWLSLTAGRAEQAAAQAMAAVSAYEAAFGATVPPAEVAANRALLAALVATNFLGLNSGAIAATEAHYAEMWAQDAAAMYGYAGASSVASRLTPFAPAAPTTNPAGVAGQAAAVAQAVNASAQDLSAVPKALSALAGLTNSPPWLTNPAAALGLTGHAWNGNGDGIIVGGMLGDLVEGLTGSATVDASTGFDAFIRLTSPTRLFTTAFKDIQGLTQAVMPQAAKAAEGAAKAIEALPQALPSALGGAAGSLGKAISVGGMLAPSGWAGSAPVATPAVSTMNGLQAATAAEPVTNALGGLPMMTGRAAGHMVAPRYGFKPIVVAQPPAGG